VCTALSRDVAAFHDRPLSDRYRYVFLDALGAKVRVAPRSRSKVLLCAMGVTLGGRRELIDFRLANSESEPTWTKFLDDLYHRGLLGHPLRLIITDGNPGLLAALEVVYPFTPHQRCWFHKMQNVVNKVRKRNRKAVVSGAQRIYEAHSRRTAIAAFWRWAERWRGDEPKAVQCIESDLEALLAHFQEPPALRATLRTINPIERVFREVRRRTRPMTVMNNNESLERIAYSVFHRLNTQWEKNPLWTSTQNS
jgi:transposase-like protein